MDVRHYFDPVDFTGFFESQQSSARYSLLDAIMNTTDRLTALNIQKLDVAIFGVPYNDGSIESGPALSPLKIREELYKLINFNGNLNIADFGNLKPARTRKGTYLALRDVVEYFNDLNIVTVVMGGSQDLTFGICEAFKNNGFFTLSIVDSLLDVKKGKEAFGPTNYLTRIFRSNPDIFQFSLLAYQGHFVSSRLLAKTKGMDEHIRLGLLREDFTLAEPVLRNSDVLSFDIGAVKYAEAPGSRNIAVNGLRSEEACQLARYAGLSDRLKVFGLFETDIEKDKNGVTAKLSAQIIWYFIEGVANRQNEQPGLNENNVTYKVEVKDLDKPLVFCCNKETKRWWFEIQSLSGDKIFVACSEKEYRKASNNEIPEIWLKYVQKIDELSK